MNIIQILILLGGLALMGVLGYLTASGQGVQQNEIVTLSVIGGLFIICIGGLVWAYRDQ